MLERPLDLRRMTPRAGLRAYGSSRWALEYNFAAAPDGALHPVFTGATWAISGGALRNTPGLGSELITNGNMETGDPPTGWSAAGGATPTGVADERTGGAGAQALNIARGTSDTGAQRSTSSGQVGWHRGQAWCKNIDATGLSLTLLVAGNSQSVVTNAVAWNQHQATVLVSPAAAITARCSIQGSAGNQGRFDDYSVKKIAAADLFVTVEGKADFDLVAPAMPELPPGMQAGAVICLDNATTPTEYVVVFFFYNPADGTSTIKVVQYSGAAFTVLASTATSYAPNKHLSLKKSGDQLKVFYGTDDFRTQVGAAVTLDAAVVGNTRHGLFSTAPECSFSGPFRLGNYTGRVAESAGSALNVVYGGSSITNSATGYRALSELWLLGTYPETTFTVHNGSVSGEDSCENYARIATDYLAYAPDLVIIDIANNSSETEFACLESLIRDVWSAYPECKFVMMKTFSVTSNAVDSNINTPTVPTTLTLCQDLGDYYGIPVIPVWENAKSDIITAEAYHLLQFLIDTVHPSPWGHNLLSSWLEQVLTPAFLTTRQSPATLPARLY